MDKEPILTPLSEEIGPLPRMASMFSASKKSTLVSTDKKPLPEFLKNTHVAFFEKMGWPHKEDCVCKGFDKKI